MAAGKKNAARLKASLVFLDESGFLMAPLVRRSWAKRGATPVLRQRTRSHQKVSAIGALVVSPRRHRVRCYFRLHPNRQFSAELIFDFVHELARTVRSPLRLIWDRLPAHRGKKARDYLKAHPTTRAVLLPPYAPELNPIEYAWGYLKCNPLANRPAFELQELTRTTRRAVRTLQTNETLLRAFIHHSPLSLRLR